MSFDVAGGGHGPTVIGFALISVIAVLLAGVWLRDRWLDWRYGKVRSEGSGQGGDSITSGGGGDGHGHGGGGDGGGGGGDGGGGW